MANSFSSRTPLVLKGALAVYPSDTPGAKPVTIPFQYNPFQVRRTLANRAPRQQSNQSRSAPEDIRRVAGPPVETINLTVEMTAADQLANPADNQKVVDSGLHPALAALEMLLYPPSMQYQQNERLAEQGEIQVSPADLPLTLLIWGKSRVVPVLVTSFSVTEEEFDQKLNPIRAKVDLGLQVLTYMELQGNSLGTDTFVSYQKQKEQLAQENQSINSADTRTTGLLPQ